MIAIGAQAIYLHTGAGEVALAEATKDSDLAHAALMRQRATRFPVIAGWGERAALTAVHSPQLEIMNGFARHQRPNRRCS